MLYYPSQDLIMKRIYKFFFDKVFKILFLSSNSTIFA